MVSYKCIHNSWVKVPRLKDKEKRYLNYLEKVFKIKTDGKWEPYYLAPHQIIWHLRDVAFVKENALFRVVKKSRNTSYTVSSIISDLVAVHYHTNPKCPYFKMNKQGAIDFIEEAKRHIKNMTPIRIPIKTVYFNNKTLPYPKYLEHIKNTVGIVDVEEYVKNQEYNLEIQIKEKINYWPFNNKEVDMKASGSIRFPNGVTWVAYPANDIAAENARGLRTLFSAGGIDEGNFMKNFEDIYVAIRDSYAGSKTLKSGKRLQQINIGTTLKGETNFSIWLKKQESITKDSMVEIFDWPIFDRELFKPYEDMDTPIDKLIPFHKNDKLISIVPWQEKESLWKIFVQSKHTFFEEYMAIQVDSDYQFYPTHLILSCIDMGDVKTGREPRQVTDDFSSISDEDLGYFDYIRMGCDPASVNDYFSFTVYGVKGNNWTQLYVINKTKIDLNVMYEKILPIIQRCIYINEDTKLTIDASPIGLDITQRLQNEIGYSFIRGVTGNKRVKTVNKNVYKINEYGHTNMNKRMLNGQLELLNDELTIKHFQVIDGTFKPAKDSDGHGDSCLSSMYANLPNNLEYAREVKAILMTEGDIDAKKVVKTDKTVREEVEEWKDKASFEDKIAFYERNY